MSQNEKSKSYVIRKPDLISICGDDINQGLTIYHQWCSQLFNTRIIGILFVSFCCGFFGIYLINFPLFLFGLNKIDYFSVNGVWNVFCMMMIFLVHIYLKCQNFHVTRDYDKKTKFKLSFMSSIPLISYPFLSLIFCSFYCAWLNIPWQTINDNDSDSSNTTIIHYSIFILSYIYGYIPNEYINWNIIQFSSIQRSRTIFFKQSFTKCLLSNFIQTFVYCLCTILILFIFTNPINSFSIFGILFRITFNLNFLWMIGYLICNRFLTEKCDMSCFNGCYHPIIQNKKYIDVRLMALNRCSMHNKLTEKKFDEYFWYLALIELLDVVQYDPSQRKNIYSNQDYYKLIIHTLLSEFTTFITKLYESIYYKNNYNQNIAQKSKLKIFWTKHFYMKPFINDLFKHYHALILSADILSFLIVHSLNEDDFGNVQESIEQILCILLECLDILDLFIKSSCYATAIDHTKEHPNQIINALYKGVETALMRIVVSMHSYLGSIKLPPKNAQRLQSYLMD